MEIKVGDKFVKKSNPKVIMIVNDVNSNTIWYHEQHYPVIRSRSVNDFLDKYESKLDSIQVPELN